MTAFASMVLERGAATLAQVEGAMENQLLFGGDLGTNLVSAGALKENALHRLLSEFYELPVGPHGRLPELSDALEELVEPDQVLLHRVFPIKRTRRTLHLAVALPLEPEVEQSLRRAVGMQLRPVVVTPLRLSEALWRHYGVPLTERDKRLLIKLEMGDIKPQISPFTQEQAPVSWVPPAPAYRRMSEHPTGVSPSPRQPNKRRRSVSAQLRSASQPIPDTLDGVGPTALESEDAELESAPPSSARSMFGTEASISEYPASEAAPAPAPVPVPVPPTRRQVPIPFQPLAGPDKPPGLAGMAPASPPPHALEDLSPPPNEGGDRDTQPYGEDGEEGEGKEGKRDTKPWTEEEDTEPPGSLRGEFHASLIESASGVDQVHQEQRAFRHRGPFTRAQAELAASQARDVQTVLEILLRYARQFFERCVLFVVQGGEARLRISNGIPRELAQMAIDLSKDSVFSEACHVGDPIVKAIDGSGTAGATALDIRLARRLGASSGTIAVVPLQIRERVVALFYGDDGSANVDMNAVDDVTDFTEICAGEVTRVIIQQKRAGGPQESDPA